MKRAAFITGDVVVLKMFKPHWCDRVVASHGIGGFMHALVGFAQRAQAEQSSPCDTHT